jgi:hypothetical protein
MGALQHCAHRAIQNQDALGQQLPQLAADLGQVSQRFLRSQSRAAKRLVRFTALNCLRVAARAANVSRSCANEETLAKVSGVPFFFFVFLPTTILHPKASALRSCADALLRLQLDGADRG